MRIASLKDTISQIHLSVDGDSRVVRVETPDARREVRLRPHMADMLLLLMSEHPQPVSYRALIKLLRQHHIAAPDATRLHRKMSELRRTLSVLEPKIPDMIHNTRDTGYSLPLTWKSPDQMQPKLGQEFRSLKIAAPVAMVQDMIKAAITLAENGQLVKWPYGYVLDRVPFLEDIAKLLQGLNYCEKLIKKELRLHDADFLALRLQDCFSKLRTYVGLARISPFPVSHSEWTEWFVHEVWAIFDEMKKWIREAEVVS